MKLYEIQLIQALKFSSNLPVRFVLAMTSLIWALSLAFSPDIIYHSQYYTVMFKAAPKEFWSVLFLLNSIGLWWRIIDYRSRVGWSRVINAWTFMQYVLVIVTSTEGWGYFLPSNSPEIMLCIMALWSTIRTDLTASDRESA